LTTEGMPSEEELREQLKQIKVDDVLLHTVVTLINLSGRRLTVEDEKDVEQARKGIEAARALVPLCPEEQVAPIKDALAQLQMIFVRETKEAPEQQEPPSQEQVEREKARSKIWTPPGTT
jgi:hypothetical protein